MRNNILKKIYFYLAILCISFSVKAEIRVGGLLGFGGTGIKSSEEVSTITVDVQRSDGPAVLQLLVEYQLSEKSSIALELVKGFSLSPYSSGVDFTGFTYKYYYPGSIPSVVESKNESSILIMKDISFYGGLSSGIAKGSINRQKDLISDVSASGVYFGFHLGADYQTKANWIFRNELVTLATMGGSGAVNSTLSAFGLMSGLIYIFN